MAVWLQNPALAFLKVRLSENQKRLLEQKTSSRFIAFVRPAGVEPATYGFEVRNRADSPEEPLDTVVGAY